MTTTLKIEYFKYDFRLDFYFLCYKEHLINSGIVFKHIRNIKYSIFPWKQRILDTIIISCNDFDDNANTVSELIMWTSKIAKKKLMINLQ